MATHRPPPTVGPGGSLSALRHLRNRYGAPFGDQKRLLLAELATKPLPARNWRALSALHDDLLFLRAFPDSHEHFRLAGAALARVEPALRTLSRTQRRLANGSGVAGSNSHYAHPFHIARWLAAAWPRAVEIDWPAVADTERLDALIRPILHHAEDDGFDNGAYSTRDWMALGRNRRHESALAWLMASVAHASVPLSAYRAFYDGWPLPLRWSLAGTTASITHNSLPVRKISPRSAMRRPPPSPVREIMRPLEGIERLSPARGARLIHVARAALAARCREVYAFTNANPAEVWLAPLGEGTSLAIIGVTPEYRLSLEANYGYLLLSNGVPIGYGGVTPLFHQANTGINIFESFRGSEGAFLWTQMLRAFHSLFGVTRFVVNAIQFGAENDEAVDSGAFWFYWRLGFRADSSELRAIAEAEAVRLAASPGRKSSPRTLRRLATGDLHLVLPGGSRHPVFRENWLSELSATVATHLKRECTHDHRLGATQIARRVASTLGVRPSGWARQERDTFNRLAPIAALLVGLDRWNRSDRLALAQLMRAKGGACEREFVARAQAHPRFERELAAAVRRGRSVPQR